VDAAGRREATRRIGHQTGIGEADHHRRHQGPAQDPVEAGGAESLDEHGRVGAKLRHHHVAENGIGAAPSIGLAEADEHHDQRDLDRVHELVRDLDRRMVEPQRDRRPHAQQGGRSEDREEAEGDSKGHAERDLLRSMALGEESPSRDSRAWRYPCAGDGDSTSSFWVHGIREGTGWRDYKRLFGGGARLTRQSAPFGGAPGGRWMRRWTGVGTWGWPPAAVLGMVNAGARADDGDEKQRRVEIVRFAGGGARLGVVLEEVSADDVSRLKLAEERGAVVKDVVPGSAAEKAGLKEDDVILSYQGERVASAAQLRRLVRETPPDAGSPSKRAARALRSG
jgi:hypothetical protein